MLGLASHPIQTDHHQESIESMQGHAMADLGMRWGAYEVPYVLV